MALPVTISGISTAVPCAGPFKSSGGNFYFVGRDGTTGGTLQVFKATDPSSSWSSIASSNLGVQSFQHISACQNGDVIHIAAVDDVNSATNAGVTYYTFNMATDAFVITAEAVHSNFNPITSASVNVYAASIVFRASDSQPIILYNGPRVASMGNSYSRIVYARRTGTNAWTNNVAVDAGGTTDGRFPEAVLGASNRTHFFYAFGVGNGALRQRTLTSANSLQTEQTGASNNNAPLQAISYDSSGTTKVICVSQTGGAPAGGGMNCVILDSADNPTVTTKTVSASLRWAGRVFNDSTTAYAMALETDNDLHVLTSTDHGATWSTDTNAFTATITTGDDSVLSRDGNVYQRGNDFVIPYVVNDNGTLKYNEYIVRSLAAAKAFAPFSSPRKFWNFRGTAR